MKLCQYRTCLVGGSGVLWLTVAIGLLDSLPMDITPLVILALLGLAVVLMVW